MKIDLELNNDELIWLANKIGQIHYYNYEIDKIYRNEDGNITIKLNEIVFDEIVLEGIKND